MEELYRRAGNEGRRRYRAEIMERLCGEHFARTAFAFDVAMRKWREVQRVCEKSLCMTGLRPTIAPRGPLGMIGNYMRRGRDGRGRQSFFDALW